MSFRVTFAESGNFKATFSEDGHIKADFSPHIEVPVADYYDGDYAVTPSASEQTVSVVGKTMRRNFTINPIPSNYGLITWNGSTLTVS